MDKKILKKWKRAGEIAATCRDLGRSLTKEGINVFEIGEAVEKKIHELEGKPAFPINISINEAAAHDTPILNDPKIIKAEDYVKIDCGVQVDGYIGDTAITVRPAGKDSLIECSEKMLTAALPFFVPGTKIKEIGEAVEGVAKEFGFQVIRNLTGHSLDRFNIHAGVSIPNIKNSIDKVLEEGEVYACEPFCTTGNGAVKDGETSLIFKWVADKPVRNPDARKILNLAKTNYSRLPFAKRWIQKEISPGKTEIALRELVRINALHAYKILKEVSGKPVAQAEHTIIVGEKPIITTKI